MRLFNTVSLEISARCNRRCEFCPVAYNHRPDERMEPALLRKAIQELGQLGYRGRIELYIYNEPCRDWEWLLLCLDAVRINAPKATVMIATNGDYLRGWPRIVELYEHGLNQLLINCYSPGLYEKRQEWVYRVLGWDASPMVSGEKSVYTATGPRSRVIQMLDKSNPQAFGTGVFSLINRAGNIPEFKAPAAEPAERMCVKPFRLLNINWNGDALVCCQDYHGDMAYGNLRDHSLVELWNHPVMNTYRERLYHKNREQPLCNVCDCHSGAYPHNVEHPSGPYATMTQLVQLHATNKAKRGA